MAWVSVNARQLILCDTGIYAIIKFTLILISKESLRVLSFSFEPEMVLKSFLREALCRFHILISKGNTLVLHVPVLSTE